jgi:hypothetical protein
MSILPSLSFLQFLLFFLSDNVGDFVGTTFMIGLQTPSCNIVLIALDVAEHKLEYVFSSHP